MRERGSRRRRLVEREPILLGGEHVLDGAIAIGLELLGAATRRLEPIRAMRAPEAHETEAGAIALLRMRAPLEQTRDETPGRGPALRGPGDQP